MKIINWFIKSSKDPKNIALTMKGLVPLLVVIGIGNTDLLQGLSTTITNIVIGIGGLISSVITLIGFIRKIILTFKK